MMMKSGGGGGGGGGSSDDDDIPFSVSDEIRGLSKKNLDRSYRR